MQRFEDDHEEHQDDPGAPEYDGGRAGFSANISNR